MLKFILLILVVGFCFLEMQAFADPSHRRDGGVSGGGGNVISPTPPDSFTHPDQVEKVVKNSHNDVQNYFFEAERDYRNGLSGENTQYKNIYKALFSDGDKIHGIIKNSYPEIEDEKPCFDSDYKPVDASFSKGHDQEICVSAFNIARKVNRKEIKAQSIGLMVHEYVELAGLSEEDAVSLQKKALKDFKE
jgi:hypothetical protein